MKIITLTLNPAFDVHCSADHFEACHENLAVITEREAGGKGVNISRALSMNGVPNLALLAVGDENGADFCRELDKDAMTYDVIELKGRIRENITIHTATTSVPTKPPSCPGNWVSPETAHPV